MIPVRDLARQDEPLRAEIAAAVQRVIAGGRFILGPEVEAFERAFAAYCGVRHCVGVASGTEALQIALLAAGIEPGDEVITVAHTAAATVAAVELAGARPVTVDIDPERMTLNPRLLPAAITPRTRAILPVHLYGQPAELESLLAVAAQYHLAVIEDCAQAAGASYRGRPAGAWGLAGAFSFYPTKPLGAYGDGGAIVTDDPDLAEAARRIRQYGWDADRISRRSGMNSRLDELQAAVLMVKLAHLEESIAERRRLAGLFEKELTAAWLSKPARFADSMSAWYAYVVRHPDRDALRAHLLRSGIATAVHYPVPVHLQPGFSHLGQAAGTLPETEAAASEVLTLPLFPGLQADELRRIADAVNGFGQ
jgi:dTDP-3-amino-3,4,6-trideoxy-alpha-D-glucose transaminase